MASPLGWVVLAGLGVTSLYLIFRPKKAVAAPAPAQRDPGSRAPEDCPITVDSLNAWGMERSYAVFTWPTASPPTWEALQQSVPPEALENVSSSLGVVLVTSDQAFYLLTGNPPVFASEPQIRQDYCAYVAVN